MGKPVIETFIYDGICEWYLRIPLTRKKNQEYSPQSFLTEYMPKDKFTFKDVLERRMEMVVRAEEAGLRKKYPFSIRAKSSETFIKEEADGLYEKYK